MRKQESIINIGDFEMRKSRKLLTAILVALMCLLVLPEVKAQSGSDEYVEWRDDSHIFKNRFVKEANEYLKEYSLDTIKAKRPQVLQTDEELYYVIEHNNFGEWVSEKQIEDRGYKYRYHWVINPESLTFSGATLLFEYIFIREPTFKGFIEWWGLKGKN